MQIAILGRQPKLSLAELESLFGAEEITLISDYAALVAVDEPLPQARLGGTIKSARLLTRLDNTDLNEAFLHLHSALPLLLSDLPEGKLQLGVSIYGFKAQKNWLLKQTLTLKKIIKKTGRSVRIIENKSEALEAAQVLYNKLTGPLGCELLLIKDGNDVIVAQTTGVQNIDDYSKRDFERPKRDAYVGMLPPKLAQIMINLAIGRWQVADGEKPTASLQLPTAILDPFCGTGVVLQEAMLMGYDVIGTDLSSKMIDYTKANLDWLATNCQLPTANCQLNQADATTHTWDLSNLQHPTSNIQIVCETYLGKPLTALPEKHKLEEIMAEANQITEGFLKNIAPQLKSGTKLCVALPAWSLGDQRPTTNESRFLHLKTLDHLLSLGYNRLDLKHATKADLIYHRPDQIVARELTILVKE